MVVSGVTGALDVIASALCDPGDAIIVPAPYYSAFDVDLVGRSGARLIRAPRDVSTPHQRSAGYLAIAQDREKYGALWDLQEAMVGHDQSWLMWRARHAVAVERQIGAKIGTGGSSGASYLQSRVNLRFYPELWEMRSQL